MIPTGKGMFIWRIERIGTPASIAAQAKAAGFSHVLVKIADFVDYADYPLVTELVSQLHAEGISVFGWQYVYLWDPAKEAGVAAMRCQITGCDGFVIDAEKECKNKPTEAAIYCHELLDKLPTDYPIGLSSYRFPSYHPELPWGIFRGICDFDMPQVYWEQAHNPAEQLQKSYIEFQAMYPRLPYIPTGAAYPTSLWEPTTADIQAFIAESDKLGLGGYNFWEWYCAQHDIPELWPIITGAQVEQPEGDRVRVSYPYGLNIRSAPLVVTGNIIGGAYYGSVWGVLGRVKDATGRTWIQVGPTAYIAGWFTEDV